MGKRLNKEVFRRIHKCQYQGCLKKHSFRTLFRIGSPNSEFQGKAT